MPCGLCEDNARAQIQDPPHIAQAINALDHSFGLCGAPAIPASPNTLAMCRTKNHSKNIVPIRVAPHCPIHFVAMLTPAAMKAQPKKNAQNKCQGIQGHERGDEAEREKMIKAKNNQCDCEDKTTGLDQPIQSAIPWLRVPFLD